MSQDVHVVKIALNYRLYDYGPPPTLDELAGTVQAVHVPGFQTEFGGRYVYGWTRFQKDLGNSVNGLPVVGLTWDKMTTSSGKLFGRIDTPENIMVKGSAARGAGTRGTSTTRTGATGQIRGLQHAVTGYSNTDSPTTEKMRYFTLDVGYDVLRAPNYKVTPFVGYSYFRYMLSAFSCTDLTQSPPAELHAPGASNRQLFLGEKDSWISWRLGTSAELRLTPWLRLTGDVACLPIVSFGGIDFHPLRTKEPSQFSSDTQLRQLEGSSPTTWLWQSTGKTPLFTRVPEQLLDLQVEQSALFVQGSYKFAGPSD